MFVSGPSAEEEAVAVRDRWPRGGAVAGALHRLRPRMAEAAEEAERVRQVERAVVMEVVADEPVGDRRLRRGGLQRGMRVDDAGGGVEAGIRDAPHARRCRCCPGTFFTSQSIVS